MSRIVPSRCTRKLLQGLAVAFALAPPMAMAGDEAAFYLETISIASDGSMPEEIVLGESLLEAGRTYTEAELSSAMHRIVRLPFVLDAEFSLKKGSERDRYELVIAVEETRRWFFGFDGDLHRLAEPLDFGQRSGPASDSSFNLVAGYRFPVGRHGVAHLALGGTDSAAEVGYSHHDLFGRGILLSATASLYGCDSEGGDVALAVTGGCNDSVDLGLDPSASRWATTEARQVRLALGVPLKGNDSLRFAARYRWTDSGSRSSAIGFDTFSFFGVRDEKRLEASLFWERNSLDDPVFPTTGLELEAGASYRERGARLIEFRFFDDDFVFDTSARELGVIATATRYWPVSPRQSLWASARLFAGRTDLSDLPLGRDEETSERLSGGHDVWRGSLTLGHTALLHRTKPGKALRELRWETAFSLRTQGTSAELGTPNDPFSLNQASTGLAYRTSWGVFRLRFTYEENNGEAPR